MATRENWLVHAFGLHLFWGLRLGIVVKLDMVNEKDGKYLIFFLVTHKHCLVTKPTTHRNPTKGSIINTNRSAKGVFDWQK